MHQLMPNGQSSWPIWVCGYVASSGGGRSGDSGPTIRQLWSAPRRAPMARSMSEAEYQGLYSWSLGHAGVHVDEAQVSTRRTVDRC